MSINRILRKNRIRSTILSAACVLAAGIASIPANASITMVKTLVVESTANYEKGIEFPLLGLHDSKPTFIAARVFKWTQQPDNQYVLEPTEDFTVYPQLLRNGPGLPQVTVYQGNKAFADGIRRLLSNSIARV